MHFSIPLNGDTLHSVNGDTPNFGYEVMNDYISLYMDGKHTCHDSSLNDRNTLFHAIN